MRSNLMVVAVVALCGATLASAQFPPLPPPPPPPTLPTPAPPSIVPIPVTLTVSGNEVQGSFELPGGFGADLTISFDNAVGLVPTALDATVALVNPVDPLLLGRLPGPGVGIPVAFPVLIRISPSATSGLSFSGAYKISLHTHNLRLEAAVPLSLFKAPENGSFRDITSWEGRGSYRDDGGGGDFSEFMIAIDLRPIDAVIVGKFDDLQTALDDHAGSIKPEVLAVLQADLAQARLLYQSGEIRQAIGEIRDFTRYVKRHGGEDIPDVWRANCSPLVNVAGLLRSGADTLKFSLDRKSNH